MADKRRNLGIPSGVVFPFAGTTAPYGYLVCDGSAISRTDYPQLFAALGTSHGQGDGSTTFNLPDYRGRFLRGVDGLAGNDPDKASRAAMATGGNTGNNVGTIQGHSFQTHTHIQNAHNHAFYFDNNSGSGATVESPSRGFTQETTVFTANATATNQDASASGATSQASTLETRPVNANVNYIIKV